MTTGGGRTALDDLKVAADAAFRDKNYAEVRDAGRRLRGPAGKRGRRGGREAEGRKGYGGSGGGRRSRSALLPPPPPLYRAGPV